MAGLSEAAAADGGDEGGVEFEGADDYQFVWTEVQRLRQLALRDRARVEGLGQVIIELSTPMIQKQDKLTL